MNRLKLFVPLIIFLLLVPLLFVSLGKDPSYLPSALVGKSFPDIRLPTLLDGRTVDKVDRRAVFT